jgi:hypothetical protein
VQATELLLPEPDVDFLLHPGMYFPFTVKVILEATLTFALITMEVRYLAVETDPANAKELNDEVSTTSVTAIVIA